MKRYILWCCGILLVAGIAVGLWATGAVYVAFPHEGEVEVAARQEGKNIFLGSNEPFEIRGVDMGVGIPGHFATEYAIDKESYVRWFGYIKAAGVNTVRVYILQSPAFYEALQEFNQAHEADPLYLIHGVWIDDYAQNSHMNAFDANYLGKFEKDVRTVIDVIHGQRYLELSAAGGAQSYRNDVSRWVLGYILGVEWEPSTVAYTNVIRDDVTSFEGEYLSTTPEATPFECMLAQVGNEAFAYETARYGEQRLVAFSNWCTTDPLEYPEAIKAFFEKGAEVDVEHIRCSSQVQSGTFASYHVYPYYPDYLRNMPEYYNSQDPHGQVNTYFAYLERLVEHHSIPVVVSEFGVPSSRGAAQLDANTGRNQGNMSELDQGLAIVQCYRDIREAGCAGSIVFTWQDEWFKRTWNTMENVDLNKTPYWSDYQTNEQYFGLLSFDPGKTLSRVYVDGDASEWAEVPALAAQDRRELRATYDEKFVYLLVSGKDVSEDTPLYIPIDTTQKSGANSCDGTDLSFDRAADFLVVLDGDGHSRVLVQERSEVLHATSLTETTGEDAYLDPPAVNSSRFVPINLILQMLTDYSNLEEAVRNQHGLDDEDSLYRVYETGALRAGDANPMHTNFDSLADLCFGNNCVEIRLPWQLLNFANPSQMQIHDDYYEHYGVDYQSIQRMYLGIGSEAASIALQPLELKGWGSKVTYHERLKDSYYLLQDLWTAPNSLERANELLTGDTAQALERARLVNIKAAQRANGEAA